MIIQFKRLLIVTYVAVGVLIPLACEQSTNISNEITVDELLANKAFQTFADENKKLTKPAAMKIVSMSNDKSSKLAHKLKEEINKLQKKNINSKSKSDDFKEIVELMGYENAKIYKDLVQVVEKAYSNFIENYPEIKNLSEDKRNTLLRETLLKYYSKHQILDFKTINKSNNKSVSSVCEDEEGLQECLQEELEDFGYSTGLCVIAGAGNFILGAGCQVLNILHFEEEKADCIEEYCPSADEEQ